MHALAAGLRAASVFFLLVFFALSGALAQSRSEANLNALADEYYWALQSRFIRPNLSERGNQAWLEQLKGYQSRLARIKVARLGETGRDTRVLLGQELNRQRRYIEDGWIYQDLNGAESLLHVPHSAVMAVERKTVADWQWIVQSLRQSRRVLSDYTTLLEHGLATERVRSVNVVKGAIRQARLLGSKNPRVSPLAALTVELEEAIRQNPRLARFRKPLADGLAEALPAYRRLGGFLRTQYLPKAPKRPQGGKTGAYQFHLDTHLGPGYTAEALSAMGRREVKRLRAELERSARKVNPNMKSLGHFMAGMRRRSTQKFGSGDELLQVTEREVAKARAFARTKLRLPRGEAVGVQSVGKAEEASADAYYSGPSDGRGTFFINTTKRLNVIPRFELPSIATHEAYPGHHAQGVYAEKNESLPDFRRYSMLASFDEGYAMYADHLRAESGGYSPTERIGYLRVALMAAAQLVADVELNTGKMTRAQARAFLGKHLFLGRDIVETKINRITNTPGQAVSYTVGLREILRLREQAKRRLGRRFNEKVFHAQLLSRGALTLPLLRANIGRWLNRSVAQGRAQRVRRARTGRVRKPRSARPRPARRPARRARVRVRGRLLR